MMDTTYPPEPQLQLFPHKPFEQPNGASIVMSTDGKSECAVIPRESLKTSDESQPGNSHFFIKLCADPHNRIVQLAGYTVIGQGVLMLQDSSDNTETFTFAVKHVMPIQTTCDILYEQTEQPEQTL